LYSFQLDDYNAVEETSDIEPNLHDEESENTRLEGHKLASMRAKVEHFEQQRETLIKQQQSLVDALSKGFNGNRQVTADHIRAINQSVKDIQLVGECIEKQMKYLQESRFQHLRSCNEDDRARVEHLKREIADIKNRMETVDAELLDLRLEQTSLRNARTKMEALENAISAREVEFQQYADVEEKSDTTKKGRAKAGRVASITAQKPIAKKAKSSKGKKKAMTDEDGDPEWSDEEAVKAGEIRIRNVSSNNSLVTQSGLRAQSGEGIR
jgi:hypothetical protein